MKEKLRYTGKSQKEIANLLGISTQNMNSYLNAADVRSGFIERLSSVLNLPVSYFYGEAVDEGKTIVSGDQLQLLKELLKEKERTIQILMKNVKE